MILHFLLCVWFCIHIGYRGTIILHELSLCTSLVHFGCGFVFTLVTGVSWFFDSCSVSFSPCIAFMCLFWVVYWFKFFFTGSPGVLFTPWIVFMCCLVLLIESYFTGFTCIVLNLYFSRSLNIGYSLTLRLLQSLQVFSN